MCQVVNFIIFLDKIIYLYLYRLSGHKDISDRLNESMYEVLDILSVYVFGRKPDHKSGERMINVDLNDESININSDQVEAIKKMKQVN